MWTGQPNQLQKETKSLNLLPLKNRVVLRLSDNAKYLKNNINWNLNTQSRTSKALTTSTFRRISSRYSPISAVLMLLIYGTIIHAALMAIKAAADQIKGYQPRKIFTDH